MPDKDPSALMLFAAGFGTRMGALTRNRPKPLIEVAGKPLIDYALALAKEAGASLIVANLHYLPDLLEAHLADTDVETVRESPDILDTGGGLKAAAPRLAADTVFTMNSDAVWSGPNPLILLKDAWRPADMDALLMCVPLSQTVGRRGGGDFHADPAGRLGRGGDLVYGGVQIIRPDRVAAWPERVFSLNDVWDAIKGQDRLFSVTYPGRWCDVGHPEGIALADAMISGAHV